MVSKEKSRQRRRKKAVNMILEKAKELNLEKHYTTVDKSMADMREAHKKGLTDGRKMRELAQVILYLNAKNQGIPIRHCDLNMNSHTARCHEKALKEEMNLENRILRTDEILDYYINKVEEAKLAKYIDRETSDGQFTPLVKAAGILYYINGYTQRKIQELTGVCTVSIRKASKHIEEELGDSS